MGMLSIYKAHRRFSLVEVFPWLAGISILTIALLAFAMPPVEPLPPNPNDTLRAALTAAHAQHKLAMAECRTKTYLARLECWAKADGAFDAAADAARAARDVAMPAYREAEAKRKAAYRTAMDACAKMPEGPQRKACAKEVDVEFGKGPTPKK